MAAAKKKPVARKMASAKKPTRAASRKAIEAARLETNRIFAMTLTFTVLSLVFLLFAIARSS